ncbi:MAG: hypothetical protein LC109_02455 [Bacteroidia bacterium]|nr:hypothetical protein [Bacteroidia bacterium]
MNENNFEKSLKEKFKNFEVEPSEGLFEKILDVRQKNRGGITFFGLKSMALLILGLLLSGSWIFINTRTYNDIKLVPNHAHTSTENNNQTTTSDKHKGSEKKLIELSDAHKLNQTDEPDLQNHSLQVGNLKTKSINQPAETNSPQGTNNANTDNNGRAAIKSGSSEIKTTNTTATIGSVKENNANITSANIFEVNARTQELSRGTIIRQAILYYQLPFHSLSSVFYPTLSYNSSFVKPEDLLYSPIPYKRPRRLYESSLWIKEIEFNLGAGMWYGAKPIDNFAESSPFSVNANIKTRFKVSKKLDFITGISYLYRTSSVAYSRTENKEVMEIDTVHGFIIDPGAPPIPVVRFDTSYNTITSYYKGTGKNIYNRFSLPLGLEYRFDIGRHLVYANGGILLTLATYDKGRWLAGVNQELETFAGKSKQIATAFNSGFFAGIGYGYVITPEFTWVVESNFAMWKFKSNPLGKEKMNQMFNAGLNTGIRWKF